MVLRSLKPDIILNLLPHIEPFVFAYSWLYGVRNFLRLGTIYSRQNTFVQWVNFVSLKLGDPVITVSNAVTESLLRKIPDARVFEISAGVDEKKFIPSQGFKPSIFTFVAVGRLIQAKGFEVLIDAIRVLLNGGCSTEFRVLIAGDGHLRSRLIQKRKDLDLEMILEFCGKVTDVKGLYARSTAFVLSSLWEGMPNSLLEAMAMELPVIASNLPQLSNCVTSENGWIFETGNADDLAKYMRIALESPKALLGHLGKNSRGKILTHYSMSVMVDQYSSVLQID
jgi:glycosyltransferase involved in cell wall biosynthesis